MNANEAKIILQLYRRHSADADDPQIAEALALAGRDPELAAWLEQHCQRQFIVGAKLRQISVPAGLKEQIISEAAANRRMISQRRKTQFALLAVILLFGSFALYQLVPRNPARSAAIPDDTLAAYRSQMTGIALRGYGMDLLTNNPATIYDYLAEKKAPADFALPVALQKVAVTGCAIQGWQSGKVSMICFRTGKPLPPDQSSDLWLFVADRSAIKDSPATTEFHFAAVNQLMTVAWAEGDKFFLLETEGDEATLRKFL